jgi:NitT/TauT family transport system substrate-binding protein
MKGMPIMIGDAATVTFWPWLKAKFGFSDTQIRKYTFNLAPFLRRQECDPGRVSVVGALCRREGRRHHAANFPARRCRLSRLRQHGAGARSLDREHPEAVQAFVDASIEGWMHYLYGDSSAGKRSSRRTIPR